MTDSPFRDIAHAIVNRQQKMDERFFNTVVDARSAENGDPLECFFEKRMDRYYIFDVNVSLMICYTITYIYISHY